MANITEAAENNTHEIVNCCANVKIHKQQSRNIVLLKDISEKYK